MIFRWNRDNRGRVERQPETSRMKYHIWTIGCQMNTADSQRLSSELEALGCSWSERAEDADVVVLNTCVVRQQAEDKIHGRLGSLSAIRARKPDLLIGLMGCLVGHRPARGLAERFPGVDVFIPPSETSPLTDLVRERAMDEAAKDVEDLRTATLWRRQDASIPPGTADSADSGDTSGGLRGAAGAGERAAAGAGDGVYGNPGALRLPAAERGQLVSAHVPIIYGCSWVCTFCIIPSRRGPERSRDAEEIVAHTSSLVQQGVREITLLGQIVDRYGADRGLDDGLPRLLERLNDVDGLERIRFLTSHPSFMTDSLLDAVAGLPKVMEHIEVPIQSGDDDLLRRMKRGYTVDEYRALVDRIRQRVPGAAIHTDIIVGFCGETERQFQNTFDVMAELRLDKAHIAKFSPRPGTVAAKMMLDDVPAEEKERRRQALDDLQAEVCRAINDQHVGRRAEVLVEGRDKQRWRARTRTNKLVFFDDPRPLLGRVLQVEITSASAWSMRGRAVDAPPARRQRELIPMASDSG